MKVVLEEVEDKEINNKENAHNAIHPIGCKAYF